MLYLYAITDACRAPEILPPGVEDAVPELLPFNGFSAVAARLRGAPARDTVMARRHMEVLTAVMPHGTVLPVRFGTTFDTRSDLNDAVVDMRDVALADLQRLRGCVELGLTVTDRSKRAVPAGAPLPDGGPGARYLAAKYAEAAERMALDRANEALAAWICGDDGPLAGVAVEIAWRSIRQPSDPAFPHAPAISISFLIPTDRLDAFRVALTQLRSTEPCYELLCTGPWPPFSFVSAGQALSTRTPHGKPANSAGL